MSQLLSRMEVGGSTFFPGSDPKGSSGPRPGGPPPPRCEGSPLIRDNKKSWRRYNERRVMRAHCCYNVPRRCVAGVKPRKHGRLWTASASLPPLIRFSLDRPFLLSIVSFYVMFYELSSFKQFTVNEKKIIHSLLLEEFFVVVNNERIVGFLSTNDRNNHTSLLFAFSQ